MSFNQYNDSLSSFKTNCIFIQYKIASLLSLLAVDPAIKSQDDNPSPIPIIVISSEARNLRSIG